MAKRIIFCAVTGDAPATGRNLNAPVTPREIAASAIDAAKAGAALAHLHARDSETKAGSMQIDLPLGHASAADLNPG